MSRPLLSTPSGLCCPVLRFLPNVAGNGLLFRLGTFLDEANAPGGSERLRQFYGDFLEAYVFNLLSDACRNVDMRMFREQIYGNPEMKSSDIAVFSGRNAVFIDVTATRFNIRDSIVGLREDNIDRDLRRFVIHKVEDEIARCARDFKSGVLIYEGVDRAEVEKIYGLVVSPQGLPRLVGLNDAINRLLPKTPEGITDWDFYDLNEIEALPRAFDGGLNLATLMMEKRADPFGSIRSLTNFLYFRRPGIFRQTATYDEILNEPFFQRILAQTSNWGLARHVRK